MRVAGNWDGSAIKAERVEAQPIKNMINRSDSAIIEGFARAGNANNIRLEGTEIELSLGNTSFSSIGGNSGNSGKVVKIEMRRDSKGGWVCDKLEQRKDRLFESKNSNQSGSNSGSGKGEDNSGSGSSSGPGSGHGSSSGSGRDDSSSGSGRGRAGRDAVDSGSSSSGGSDRSGRGGGSGSGKYR